MQHCGEVSHYCPRKEHPVSKQIALGIVLAMLSLEPAYSAEVFNETKARALLSEKVEGCFPFEFTFGSNHPYFTVIMSELANRGCLDKKDYRLLNRCDGLLIGAGRLGPDKYYFKPCVFDVKVGRILDFESNSQQGWAKLKYFYEKHESRMQKWMCEVAPHEKGLGSICQWKSESIGPQSVGFYSTDQGWKLR